jgi:hypothetical protein
VTTALGDSQQLHVFSSLGSFGGGTAHLTGVVPADGKLLVIHSGENGDEGGTRPTLMNYRFSLTTATSVPVPASLALVAVGVVGLGSLHVARSRNAP